MSQRDHYYDVLVLRKFGKKKEDDDDVDFNVLDCLKVSKHGKLQQKHKQVDNLTYSSQASASHLLLVYEGEN